MLTAIAFLAAYATGCILSLARHPIYGLATYIALIYVHPPAQWWGKNIPSFRWSLLAAAVTLVSLYIHKSDAKAPKAFEFGLMKGLAVFVIWLIIQSAWALNPSMHAELLTLTIKYTVLAVVMYKCIETSYHLRVFLWAHAGGCFYLGTIVFTQYVGGRFEGFEGPGISEANAAALMIATGILVTFVLFLTGRLAEKITAIGFMPFTLNALISTISRSGFLALGIAGIIYNLFAPKKSVRVVRAFSILGLVLFVVLTNPVYWERIGTILVAGEDIEGVDTGSKRVVLMGAQLKMFSEYPLGCGHRCTAVLSPIYLDDRYLSGPEGKRARSSHNTFMSLLVEQGLPGAIFYALLLYWMAKTGLKLRKRMRERSDFVGHVYASTVAILGAITVGDMFVDYLKFEARVWFLVILMVLVKIDAKEQIMAISGESPSDGRSESGTKLDGRGSSNSGRA